MRCVRRVLARQWPYPRPELLASEPLDACGRPSLRPLHRLVVTRPEKEAGTWVQALRAEGWPAQALPLIAIAEPGDAAVRERLHQARAHWLTFDAIMFVSAAAVQHFFSAEVLAPSSANPRTRFWAPGPGTARALAQALVARGLGAEHVDAPAADASQFDSESLWPVVASKLRPGHRVLIVRGASPDLRPADTLTGVTGQGRDWLIQQCQAAGAHVEACVAYERRAPALDAVGLALLVEASATGSLWLFSSSEALAHLQTLATQVVWTQASALATHPRIAVTARAAGFGQVLETRPALPDVLRALESNWSRP